MARQKIVYDVEFNSSAGVQKLKQELQSLKNMTLNDLVKVNTQASQKDLESLKRSIAAVDTALDKSYSLKLNSTNVETFNQSLAKSKVSLNQIGKDFANAGIKGQIAFRNMATQLLTNNTQLKKTNSLLNSMATTLGNTIKWSIASGAIRMVTGGIRDAWNYTVKLDTSLNDIRIVTGKSADEMEKFAKQANKAAKELGNSTTAYTKASLIYYQQGLSEADVKARTDVTIKAANVTGQATAEVSEQLTAVWNGYKVASDEAEKYVDKLAAVAASTAVDLEELSVGMSKVASSAHAMGVDIDQLTAQIATIGSVTRQDTSIVGTALKTIFARMGDLKVDGVDEFGVKLGDVTSKMQQMGIQVLDSNGDLRDMGSIIEEVAGKWSTWTQAQQQAAAVALAGKRQYNNLIALFENWDMYESALATSEGSEGTLQKQQNVYMDSLQAHLDQLKVSGEKVYDALFDSDSMKKLIDGFADIKESFAGFVNAIGGGGQLLTNFGVIASTLFQKQISGGIANAVLNLTGFNSNVQQIKSEIKTTTEFANMQQPAVQKLVELKNEELKYAKLLSAEEKDAIDKQIQEITNAQNKVDLAEEELRILKEQGEIVKNKYGLSDEDLNNDLKKESVISKIEKTEDNLRTQNDSAENLISLNEERETDKGKDKYEIINSRVGEVIDYMDAERGDGGVKDLIQTAKNSGDYSAEQLAELNQLRDQAAQEIQEYKDALLELAEAEKTGLGVGSAQLKVEKTGNKVKETGIALGQKQSEIIGTQSKNLQIHKNYIEKGAQAQDKANQKQKEATRELKNSENAYKSFIQATKTKAMVNNIMGVVNGISQMASAISTLKNLGSIFKNEDMTNGEKLLAVIQNLTMSVPMLISGYSMIRKSFSALGVSKREYMLIEKKFLSQNNRSATQQVKNAIFVATGEKVKKKDFEKTIRSMDRAQFAAFKKALIEQNSAASSGAAVTFWEKIKQKAFMKTALTSIKSAAMALAPWLPLIGIIAAVTVGVLALVAAFKEQDTEADKANKILEQEKNNLAAVNEQYKSLNEQLTNVSNKFDELTKKQKAINDLQVGTEEWTKAVRENNQAIVELLSNYSELAPYVTTDSNGVMAISTEGQEIVQEKLQEKTDKAYASTITQQQRVLEAQNNAIKANAAQNKDLKNFASKGQTGRLLEARMKGRFGHIADGKLDLNDVIGTIPILGIKNAVDGEEEEKEQLAMEQMDKWLDAYQEGTLAIDDLKEVYGEEANAVWEQIVAMDANTKAVKALEAQFAAAYFANDINRQDAFSQQAFDAWVGSTITNTKSNYEDTYYTTKSGGFLGIGAKDVLSEQAELDFAKKHGVSVEDLEYIEQDGVRKIKIKGQEDSTAIQLDAVIEDLSKTAAADAIDTEKIKEYINAAYVAGDEAGSASLVNLVGGADYITLDADTTTIADTSTANLNATQDAIFDSYKKSMGIDKPEIQAVMKALHIDENEYVARQLEYDSYEEYQKSFEKTKKIAQDSVDKLNAGHLNTAFNAKNFESATLTQAKAIADSFEKVFQSGGGEAAEALNGLLDQFTDPETQTKISQIAASIDWTDLNAANQFKAALDDANIIVDTTSNYWVNIVDSMTQAANVAGTIVNKFATLRKSLAEIKKITDDISSSEIISDEDYQNIVKYNPEIKKLFIQTVDGFQYIGNSKKELKELASVGYQSLDTITSQFSGLSSSAEVFSDMVEDEEAKFEISLSGSQNIATANKILEADNDAYVNVLAANGMNKDTFDAAMKILNDANADKSSEEYKNAMEVAKSAINAVNTSISAYKTGQYSPEQALETWISYENDSWSDIQAALIENGYDSESDLYEKFEEKWKNDFLNELGFEGLASALGATALEGHLKNIRKLELDYFKKINKELDKLNVKIEKAFGSDKLALLNQRLNLKKDEQATADILNNSTQTSWIALRNDFIANAQANFGVAGSTLTDDNGDIDIKAVKDLQLTFDKDSEEYKNLQNIIDLWEKAGEAAQKAAEAAWAVIDAQIESFKYQQDINKQFYEFQKSWLEFGQEFRSYADEGFSMFESKSAADLVNDAFESYQLNFSNAFNLLDSNNENSPFHELLKAVDLTSESADATEAKTAKQNYLDALTAQASAETSYNNAMIEKAAADERLSKATDKYQPVRDALSEFENSILTEAERAEMYSLEYADECGNIVDDEAYERYLELYNKQRIQGDMGVYNVSQADLDNAYSALNYAENECGDLEVVQDEAYATYENMSRWRNVYGEKYDALLTAANAAATEFNAATEAAATASELVSSTSTALETANANVTSTKTALDSSLSDLSIYGGVDENGDLIINEAALQADFEEAIGEAQDKIKELQDNLSSMYDAWGTAQEELMALYDTEIDKISNINDIIKTQVDLRKTLSRIQKNTEGYTSYNSQTDYNTIAINAKTSYDLAQAQLTTAKSEYDKVMALGENASKEMIQTVTENLTNAQNAVLSASSEWIEAITTKYREEMNDTINSFVETATNGLNLDEISEEWQHTVAKDERYLDSINSAYAEESLMRKFETSIDETDSIVAQNKLKEKQLAIEQKLVDIKEEQGKLSQYDLDRANAEYELTLKQIALEEAQQTANKMKLTRDASGNYSYQYVADQDAIAKAEEDLAAAENSLYNLDKDRTKELVEEYWSIFAEGKSAIDEAMANGEVERAERLREYYNTMLNNVQNELGVASGNLSTIGKDLSNNSSWVSDFASATNTIAGMNLDALFGDSGSLDTLLNGESGFSATLKSAASTIETSLTSSTSPMVTGLSSLQASIDNTEDALIESLTPKVSELTTATTKILDELPGLASAVDALKGALDTYAGKYKNWFENNDTNTDETPEDLEENTEALQALTQAAIGLANKWDNDGNANSTTFNGVTWTLGSDNVWTQDTMDDDNT